MFILYGMSSAWAVLVHYVTSLKHRYFSGESLVYPRCYGGGCIFIFYKSPDNYVVDLKLVRWPSVSLPVSSDTLVDIFVIFFEFPL